MGKHAMILGADYVVMSRTVYEAWVKRMKAFNKYDPSEGIDAIDIDAEEAEKAREYDEQLRKDGMFPKG